MKRLFFSAALVLSLLALVSTACTKQCDCHKVTHYETYSTEQYFTETIDMDESCSRFNGEFFHEDMYGNTVSVDVVTCRESR